SNLGLTDSRSEGWFVIGAVTSVVRSPHGQCATANRSRSLHITHQSCHQESQSPPPQRVRHTPSTMSTMPTMSPRVCFQPNPGDVPRPIWSAKIEMSASTMPTANTSHAHTGGSVICCLHVVDDASTGLASD